jgi:hypothetical protein
VPAISHQTIKLSKGKHTSPEHGACVLELASMLAGERFSDHPRSVSRTIGAFLRGYNDLLDDRRRQDLYGYAAQCVGTAQGDAIEQARIEHLLTWAGRLWARGGRQSWWSRLRGPTRRQGTDPESVANYALRALHRVGCPHASVLAMLDDLIALGEMERTGHIDLAAPINQPRLAEPSSGGRPERLQFPALGELR